MRTAAIALAFVTLGACVHVEYLRPGTPIEPRAGEAMVFTRIRFLDDGREWFPWDPSFVDLVLGAEQHRHFWLRRLDRHAVTPELQPDKDGSLALRLEPGDYALVGTDEDFADPSVVTRFEIVALLRLPPGQPFVYAGELTLVAEHPEGWSVVTHMLGEPVVEHASAQTAADVIETKYGRLPELPVVSPWCVGPGVPSFDEPDGPAKARVALDRGCPQMQ